jgi:hypothetical protein
MRKTSLKAVILNLRDFFQQINQTMKEKTGKHFQVAINPSLLRNVKEKYQT